jgi:cell wall-associated NlpC family hydrolase
MPPHYHNTLTSYLSPLLRRSVKYLLLASSLALTGCAATTSKNSAYADASLGNPELLIRYESSERNRATRDRYLSRTQADPLGAYLSRRENLPGSEHPDNRMLATAALKHLGVKYRFGGDTPSTGFDCSGLVSYAAEKSLGLKLPRRSAEIARQGKSVKKNELKKGDLVFFNTLGQRFSHVGIYLGNKKFVHAPRTGAVVRIESMETSYWKKRYNGARRLDGGEMLASAN